MKSQCIQPQDLPRVLTLPAHDAQRQHLDTCLHCRAMAHAYAEFLDADGVRPGFDLDGADAELAARLATAIEGAATAARPRARPSRLPRQRVWFAAAAVLLVCAGIFLARDAVLLREARLPEGGGLVRGETEDATGLAWTRGDTGWRLTWRTDTPGAPVMVFLDADLEELARRALTGLDGELAHAELAAPDGAVYLQLVFEKEGDVVARSAVIAAKPVEP